MLFDAVLEEVGGVASLGSAGRLSEIQLRERMEALAELAGA